MKRTPTPDEIIATVLDALNRTITREDVERVRAGFSWRIAA